MRSSRSDSPKTFIWIAAAAVLLVGGLATAWLLRGSSGSGGEQGKAPALQVGKAAEEPDVPPTFPEPAPQNETKNIDLSGAPPTRPRSAEAVAQIGGPTGDIEGLAVDTKGRPIEGVHISAYLGNNMVPGFPMAHDSVDATTTSAADGSFKLKNVPVAKAVAVVGEHDDYARSEVPGINV